MKASANNPSLTCSAEEYEEIIESSSLHQCGKFAIVQQPGVTRVRLPKVVYASGGLNISNIGNLSNQRILIAKKEPTEEDLSWYNWYSDGWLEQGGEAQVPASWTRVPLVKPYLDTNYFISGSATNAIKDAYTTEGSTSAGCHADFMGLTPESFQVWTADDASFNGSVCRWVAKGYTEIPTEEDFTIDFAPLQYYYIQIATGLETVVDIENHIQVSTPYSIGDSKYSPVFLNNLSWLQGGVTASKNAYPAFYNYLYNAYENHTTIGEGSVKLVTDNNISRLDFVINPFREEFTLPTLNGTETTPSSKFTQNKIDVTTQVTEQGSGAKVTASYNGWLQIKAPYEENKFIHLYNLDTLQHASMSSASSGDYLILNIWVNRFDVIQVEYNTSTVEEATFLIASNPGHLYFFVGDTLQHANIINANRAVEQMPYYLVKSWTNGTEWYRVYSDGWCEQGGYSKVETGTGPVSIYFHKKFIDTNINISVTPMCANTTASYEMASVGAITTESFKIYMHGSIACTRFWRACGYIR